MEITNVMPDGQGKRDSKRNRYDLIPLEWKKMMAEIFEEGLTKYGDTWLSGGNEFLIDCLNHAEEHLGRFNDGDYFNEPHLQKVAWNCLAVAYHIRKNPDILKEIANHRKKI